MKSMLKTTLLLAALTAMFMAIGYFVGGRSGMMVAFVMAAAMNFGMYWFSSKLVLKMQGATPLDKRRYPEVYTMIHELATRDNLPMPKLYFVDTPIPNAFATGRSPQHAVVAVTRGIMEILDGAELRAVLAHELGHVKNRDMLVSTIAATFAGAISMLADMLMWGNLFGGGDSEEGGNPLGTLAAILLAPFAAMVIQMAVSRSREYLADEHSAHTIGHGEDLARALQKLEDVRPALHNAQPSTTQQATAHLMFINLFNARGLASLFSTHPSTKDRIARLRQLR